MNAISQKATPFHCNSVKDRSETFKNLAYRSDLVLLDQELASYNHVMNVMTFSVKYDTYGDIVPVSAVVAGDSVMGKHIFKTISWRERGGLWCAGLTGKLGRGILDQYNMKGVS